jgi:hypothetical protein
MILLVASMMLVSINSASPYSWRGGARESHETVATERDKGMSRRRGDDGPSGLADGLDYVCRGQNSRMAMY